MPPSSSSFSEIVRCPSKYHCCLRHCDYHRIDHLVPAEEDRRQRNQRHASETDGQRREPRNAHCTHSHNKVDLGERSVVFGTCSLTWTIVPCHARYEPSPSGQNCKPEPSAKVPCTTLLVSLSAANVGIVFICHLSY